MRRWLHTIALLLAATGARADSPPLPLDFDDRDGLVTVMDGERPLVGYQHGHMPPPAGVDPAFGRSGFIHPLWSPGGQVLTRIQPPDHYHHYGIWNPWTRVRYDGHDYDLWNLADRKGTVRFAGFANRQSAGDMAELAVRHEHVAFVAPDTELVILDELQTIRVHRPAGDRYRMDLVIELTPATDKPVELPEYRYGGFGWRATGAWHAGNSEILASEGQDRSTADNTTGRWFLAQGDAGGEWAGALVMSHPSNFNHPEPLRIWPAGQEGGDVFATFAPTRNTGWTLEPGRTYTRTYRFLVYDGRLGREAAESAWREFAATPVGNGGRLFPGIDQCGVPAGRRRIG